MLCSVRSVRQGIKAVRSSRPVGHRTVLFAEGDGLRRGGAFGWLLSFLKHLKSFLERTGVINGAWLFCVYPTTDFCMVKLTTVQMYL